MAADGTRQGGNAEQHRPASPRSARIPAAGGVRLDGELTPPQPGAGLVVFAHGSGSSRHSPRNRSVARALAQRGLGTLLMDLLTPAEEVQDARTAHLRFDIELLADRVVSRGGRPDLAGRALGDVCAPTLLMVGGDDRQVIDLNESALGALRSEKALEIVPGATHLFEEPGALEQVAELAGNWFVRHLGGPEEGG